MDNKHRIVQFARKDDAVVTWVISLEYKKFLEFILTCRCLYCNEGANSAKNDTPI